MFAFVISSFKWVFKNQSNKEIFFIEYQRSAGFTMFDQQIKSLFMTNIKDVFTFKIKLMQNVSCKNVNKYLLIFLATGSWKNSMESGKSGKQTESLSINLIMSTTAVYFVCC